MNFETHNLTHEVVSMRLAPLIGGAHHLSHLTSIPVAMANYTTQQSWFGLRVTIVQRLSDLEPCMGTLATHLSISADQVTDSDQIAVAASDAAAINRALGVR